MARSIKFNTKTCKSPSREGVCLSQIYWDEPYQVSLAARLGYLEDDAHHELSGLCVETSKVIAGILRALRP